MSWAQISELYFIVCETIEKQSSRILYFERERDDDSLDTQNSVSFMI